MRRKHHGQISFAIQPLDQLQDSNRPVRIDAEGRLIEDDGPGIFNQNFGDAEALLHAAGELPNQSPAVFA